MVFLSEYVDSVFPVKSTKVGRKYTEALGSEILACGLQIDRYSPSAFSFETVCGLHSVELGFLKKASYCITTYY